MTLSSFSNESPSTTAVPTFVALRCELVRGTEACVLAELLPRVKRESVVLDLSAVERIDAAGIATLITLYCTAIEFGMNFSVLSPSSRVLTLLRLVGLEPILVTPVAQRIETADICTANDLGVSAAPLYELACSAA